uniref:Uncharacterized protein n=1 Tax=Manihot esculenta TaxID=3983 RepID=A0A199UAL2_MANES
MGGRSLGLVLFGVKSFYLLCAYHHRLSAYSAFLFSLALCIRCHQLLKPHK